MPTLLQNTEAKLLSSHFLRDAQQPKQSIKCLIVDCQWLIGRKVGVFGQSPMLKNGVDEPSEVHIFNTLGEKVTTPSLLRNATPPKEGNFQVDISDLPKGIYFVKIGGETAKFVKM